MLLHVAAALCGTTTHALWTTTFKQGSIIQTYSKIMNGLRLCRYKECILRKCSRNSSNILYIAYPTIYLFSLP